MSIGASIELDDMWDNVISPTEERCPGGVFDTSTVETVVPAGGATLEVLG